MTAATAKKDPWTIYFQPKFLVILALGFSSGLPLALTGGTLTYWMREDGVDLTTIGIFAAVGIPYTLKFLWSPIVDHMPLPILSHLMGRRSSWILIAQIGLIISIFALGQNSPQVNPFLTALFAFTVAFFSATQDIVIDAFRIERLSQEEQPAGAASYVAGYRIALLVSGAGAFYIATYFSWGFTYAVMAVFMLVGVVTILFAKEPEASVKAASSSKPEGFVLWIKKAVIDPFADFLKHRGWVVILLFITLFKFGDALVGAMTSPFLKDMGFSKIEVANISKIFGFIATIVGLAIGGFLAAKLGLFKALLISAFLQIVSTFMFVWQAQVGYNVELLAATIAAENLASGMGTAVFLAYLSLLCNINYTATQYALFSSLFAISRTLLSTPSGALAENFGWEIFFILTMFAAIPGIILLFIIRRYDAKEPDRKIFT